MDHYVLRRFPCGVCCVVLCCVGVGVCVCVCVMRVSREKEKGDKLGSMSNLGDQKAFRSPVLVVMSMSF
jgi:hypothetical protein